MTCLAGTFEMKIQAGFKLKLPKPILREMFNDNGSNEGNSIYVGVCPERHAWGVTNPRIIRVWESLEHYREDKEELLGLIKSGSFTHRVDKTYINGTGFAKKLNVVDGSVVIPLPMANFLKASTGTSLVACGDINTFEIMTEETSERVDLATQKWFEQSGLADPLELIDYPANTPKIGMVS